MIPILKNNDMNNKQYLRIAALLFGALILVCLVYAISIPVAPHTNVETIFIDKTDDFAKQATGAEVLLPIGLRDNSWQSVQLKICTFSDYDFTESKAFSLRGEVFMLGNPTGRKKEVDRFEKKIDGAIRAINSLPGGCTHSSIYAPFIRELNRMASLQAYRKVAINYGDLFENTQIFSVYKKEDWLLLKTHPEKVKELLAQFGKPADFSGLKIYLVYKPETDRDNEYYQLMSGFYKKLFEGAGAQVFIGANLSVENN